jgi:hypothetical protein
LHYHPSNHPDLPDEDDQEFIEVLNISDAPVDLSGVQITQFAATAYVFADGVLLAPGEYIVVARNPAALVSIHGDNFRMAPDGYANRNLSNGGETVALVGPLGNELLSFTYDDVAPWPETPDGDGPSLEIIDPLGDPNDPANWRASSSVGGSPGRSGAAEPGDFELDGDVDGGDFLAWQRGFGMSTGDNDLADWETNFGLAANSAIQLATMDAVSTAAVSAAQRGPSRSDLRDAASAFWRIERRDAFMSDEASSREPLEVLGGIALPVSKQSVRRTYEADVRTELVSPQQDEQAGSSRYELIDALFSNES